MVFDIVIQSESAFKLTLSLSLYLVEIALHTLLPSEISVDLR